MSDVKSRREEYAQLTREAIVDSARQLFVEHGYAATSVDDIARAARISKGAVYHHFTDKQRLFAEVFRQSQAGVMTRVAAAAAAEHAPWARAEAAARGFLRCFRSDGTARALLRQSMNALDERQLREIDDQTALPLVLPLLTEVAEAGELRPVERLLTARIVFSVLCEAAVTVAFAEDPEQIADQAEEIVLHLVRGLRQPGGDTTSKDVGAT